MLILFLMQIPDSKLIQKALLFCTLLILKTGRVILNMVHVYEMLVFNRGEFRF